MQPPVVPHKVHLSRMSLARHELISSAHERFIPQPVDIDPIHAYRLVLPVYNYSFVDALLIHAQPIFPSLIHIFSFYNFNRFSIIKGSNISDSPVVAGKLVEEGPLRGLHPIHLGKGVLADEVLFGFESPSDNHLSQLIISNLQYNHQLSMQSTQSNPQTDQELFNNTLKLLRDQISQLRSELKGFSDLKKQHKNSQTSEFQQLALTSTCRLHLIKSQQISLADQVEKAKIASEAERSQVDDHNLKLQSLQYEKDYFVKEIHFCKEFKTPQLQMALKPDVYEKFRSINPNITEQQNQENLRYLLEQVNQRKTLSQKLTQVQQEKKKVEIEFKKKQKLVDDFPQILQSLENASLPLQEYLNVKLTDEQNNLQQADQLPYPLRTLYTKVSQFTKNYPMFCLDVQIKGDPDQVDQSYLRYQSQLMHNLKFNLKANRTKVTQLLEEGSNLEQEQTQTKLNESPEKVLKDQMPGISDSSKKIKKDKKKKKDNEVPPKKSASKPRLLPESGALEEGEEEEGANIDANMVSMDVQFDPDEKPSTTLISKYQKFPLWIEISVMQNPYFLDFLKPFTQSNVYSIKVLKDQTKDQLNLQLFPLVIRVYLVPEINVLSIELRHKYFNTDQILGDLFIGDQGNQVNVQELTKINSESNERLYEWLHNWAGLKIESQKQSKNIESPSFSIIDQDLMDNAFVSTNLVVAKIWRRLISKSILTLQLDYFQANKQFLKEIQDEFMKKREFQILQPRFEIFEFKRNSQNIYEISLKNEKQQQYSATITIPLNYPEQPPRFELKMLSQNQIQDIKKLVGKDLIEKMDMSDFHAVEELRSKHGSYLAHGEPVQPIIDSIQDELHLYFEDFIMKDQHLDFLLSFQIRKLFNCLEILSAAMRNSEDEGSFDRGLNALVKQVMKGRFKKRPFSYNENLNVFEQR